MRTTTAYKEFLDITLSTEQDRIKFYLFFPLLLNAGSRVEKWWWCKLGGNYLLWILSVDLGDNTSSREKAIFWAFLLYPSTLCFVCHLLGLAYWWCQFQQSCRRNISFYAWSLSKVLPVTKDCQHSFSNMLSVWYCQVGSSKTCK